MTVQTLQYDSHSELPYIQGQTHLQLVLEYWDDYPCEHHNHVFFLSYVLSI